MGSFTYGWDQPTQQTGKDLTNTSQLNPIGSPGGAIGSQVRSQANGQGAGLTPSAGSFWSGGDKTGGKQTGYWGGPTAYAGNPDLNNQPGGASVPSAGRQQEGFWGGPTAYAGNPAPSNQPAPAAPAPAKTGGGFWS